jgi:hypothetical protein
VKLIVQLFSISSLCVIGWVPYGVVSTMLMIRSTEQLSYLLSTFFIYLPYVQTLLLPHICFLFIPDIKRKFLTLFASFYGFIIILSANKVHVMNDEHNPTQTQLPLATIK